MFLQNRILIAYTNVAQLQEIKPTANHSNSCYIME